MNAFKSVIIGAIPTTAQLLTEKHSALDITDKSERMAFKEYSVFTFDSRTIYQMIDNVEEKVCRWTLSSNNSLIYEVFPDEIPNEKHRKMGMYVIPERKVYKLSSEQYSKWVNYLRDCALHGEYKGNGDRRDLHEY